MEKKQAMTSKERVRVYRAILYADDVKYEDYKRKETDGLQGKKRRSIMIEQYGNREEIGSSINSAAVHKRKSRLAY